MTTLKFLLSDKFVEFGMAIADVHKEIKSLTVQFQADLKDLREKADSLRTDFETWEKEQEGSPKAAKFEAVEKTDTTVSTFGGHPKDDKGSKTTKPN